MAWYEDLGVKDGLKVGDVEEAQEGAIFEVSSTNKGSIPFPQLTTVQRDAIPSPPAGLFIYNTTTKAINYFDGTVWKISGADFDDATIVESGGKRGVNSSAFPQSFYPSTDGTKDLGHSSYSWNIVYANLLRGGPLGILGTTSVDIDSGGAIDIAASGVVNLNSGSGTISANSKKISSLADPTNAQDAATKAYVDDNAGGAGTGGINYIADNSDAESGVGAWTTFNDGATLTDGTGGTPGVTFGVTTTAPLRGAQSYLFTKPAANHLNEGFAIDFTLDEADKNKTIYITGDIVPGTGYVTDDLKFAIYDKTSLTLYKQGEGQLKAKSVNGRLMMSWPAGTNTDLRLIGYVANSNTNGFTAKLDNMSIGTAKILDVPIVTEWESWTPTWDGVTLGNATQTFQRKRVGDTLHIRGQLNLGSTSSVTGTIGLNIPSGLNIDYTKTATSSYAVSGTVTAFDSSGTSNREVFSVQTYIATNQLIFFGRKADDTAITFNATSPFTWGSGDQLRIIDIQIPIAEWANSSALMSTTDMMNQTAKAVVTSNNAPAIGTSDTLITFNGEVVDDLGLYTSGTFTAPETKEYEISGFLLSDTETWSAGQTFSVRAYVNGVANVWLARWTAHGAFTQRADVHVYGVVSLQRGQTLDIRASSSVATNLINDANWNRITIKELLPEFSHVGVTGEHELLSATSATKTPSGSAHHHNLTGNSLTLSPGTFELLPSMVKFNNGGSSPVYSFLVAAWFAANGTDAGTLPAALSTATGLTVLSSTLSTHAGEMRVDGISSSTFTGSTSSVIVRVTQQVTIYLVTYANMTTPANSRITVYPTARRLQ